MIIFDDTLLNEKYSAIAAETFARGRHRGISCIFVTQNIYYPSKHFRIISLNSNYVFLFKIRDRKQLTYFANSFLSKDMIESFLMAYKKYVTNKKFGHIMIDFNCEIESPLLIRTNIASKTEYEYAIKL